MIIDGVAMPAMFHTVEQIIDSGIEKAAMHATGPGRRAREKAAMHATGPGRRARPQGPRATVACTAIVVLVLSIGVHPPRSGLRIPVSRRCAGGTREWHRSQGRTPSELGPSPNPIPNQVYILIQPEDQQQFENLFHKKISSQNEHVSMTCSFGEEIFL